jgi:prephenate dehydratase
MAVQHGAAERAVVPIENALEGGVADTLDALAGDAEDVRIVAELVHPIRHCLVAARELRLEEVTRVSSHPQALAQCARFLGARLPRAARVGVGSTSEAVLALSGSNEPHAALGSRLSADLYGCRVLVAGVEDRPDNLTRFVWLAPAAAAGDPEPPAKTSLVFWGAGDESPGWLVDVLREFAERGINLTKIESRPRRVRLGHYMFFVDLEGAAQRSPVSDALAGLAGAVAELRVLGSYPVARSHSVDE